MEYLSLISRSLQYFRKDLFSNCNLLSEINVFGTPNLIIMFFQTNFFTFTSQIFAKVSASTHFVNKFVATMANLLLPVALKNASQGLNPTKKRATGKRLGSGAHPVDGYSGSSFDNDHTSLHNQQHPFAFFAPKNLVSLHGAPPTSLWYNSYRFPHTTWQRDCPPSWDEDIVNTVPQMTIDTTSCHFIAKTELKFFISFLPPLLRSAKRHWLKMLQLDPSNLDWELILQTHLANVLYSTVPAPPLKLSKEQNCSWMKPGRPKNLHDCSFPSKLVIPSLLKTC